MAISVKGAGGENVTPEVTEQAALIEEIQALLATKCAPTVTITDDGAGNISIVGLNIVDGGDGNATLQPDVIEFYMKDGVSYGTNKKYTAPGGSTWNYMIENYPDEFSIVNNGTNDRILYNPSWYGAWNAPIFVDGSFISPDAMITNGAIYTVNYV